MNYGTHVYNKYVYWIPIAVNNAQILAEECGEAPCPQGRRHRFQGGGVHIFLGPPHILGGHSKM